MERVKKGERYWYITVTLNVWSRCEDGDAFGEELIKINNYFHTKEEAEAVARKLQAVLKGAEVIEWPKELDVYLHENDYIETYHQDQAIKDLVGLGMLEMERWLRNKIVK